MAWNWNTKPVATVKVEEATDKPKKEMYTFQGCTTADIEPAEAIGYLNAILNIGGKSAAVTAKMSRTQTEGVENDG